MADPRGDDPGRRGGSRRQYGRYPLPREGRGGPSGTGATPAAGGSVYGRPDRPIRNGLSTASLVIGVTVLLLSTLFPGSLLGGMIAAPVGLILGIVALVRVRRGDADGKGPAIGGIVTSSLAVLVVIAKLVALYVAVG